MVDVDVGAVEVVEGEGVGVVVDLVVEVGVVELGILEREVVD